MSGQLYVGTSGFAYPDWAPRFYPSGTRGAALLPFYAGRLPAVELNNTFYRHPGGDQVRGWLDATPAAFRFSVKAQRGGSGRALLGDPGSTLEWLLRPYRLFGERLGTILFRIPGPIERDDGSLDRLLRAWPADLPVTFEFQHPSWEDDWVHERLRAAEAALCITDLPTLAEPPTVRLTGPFLYLRLRRDDYDTAEVAAWAARVEPFLSAGQDVYCFFKHDATGRATELANDLKGLLAAFGPR
ncbi:MAG: DUF72 domain-containing protein [Candidatus Limnocylindrales bacterium]